jgi:dynein heavy chain
MQRMEQFLEDYNNNLNFPLSYKKTLNLVMFLDACETASKISRCLTLEMGHCLILGTGGKGRNCLARLGCFLSGHKMFEAGINQDYSMRMWQDDLKKVLMSCGVEKM